jgi:hypothetical protein
VAAAGGSLHNCAEPAPQSRLERSAELPSQKRRKRDREKPRRFFPNGCAYPAHDPRRGRYPVRASSASPPPARTRKTAARHGAVMGSRLAGVAPHGSVRA